MKSVDPVKAAVGLVKIDDEMLHWTSMSVYEHVSKVVRPVVTSPTPEDFRTWSAGSAEVLCIDDRYFLVTAAHNIAKDDRLQQLGLSVGLTPNLDNTFDPASVVWLDRGLKWGWANGARLVNERTGTEHTAGDSHVDIAAVELDRGVVSGFGFEPLGVDQLFPAVLGPGIVAIICGYPGALYTRLDEARGLVRATCMRFVTQGVPFEDRGAEWSPAICQVLHYPNERVDKWDGQRWVPDPLPDPHGISGCAILTLVEEKGALMSYRSLRFCGIQHHYNETRQWVTGTSTGAVVQMLGNVWPELRPTFERFGFTVFEGDFKPV